MLTVMQMENACVTAVCDNFAPNVERALASAREKTENEPAFNIN
jgi:hypothetical protein